MGRRKLGDRTKYLRRGTSGSYGKEAMEHVLENYPMEKNILARPDRNYETKSVEDFRRISDKKHITVKELPKGVTKAMKINGIGSMKIDSDSNPIGSFISKSKKHPYIRRSKRTQRVSVGSFVYGSRGFRIVNTFINGRKPISKGAINEVTKEEVLQALNTLEVGKVSYSGKNKTFYVPKEKDVEMITIAITSIYLLKSLPFKIVNSN